MRHNILTAFIFLMLTTGAALAATVNIHVGLKTDGDEAVMQPDKLIVVSPITTPLLVTYETSGKLEGAGYDRIGAVLVNAFTEQQTKTKLQDEETKGLREQIKKLQAEIEALRSFVICRTSMRPELCGELE